MENPRNAISTETHDQIIGGDVRKQVDKQSSRQWEGDGTHCSRHGSARSLRGSRGHRDVVG
jgi:hypothetical protein